MCFFKRTVTNTKASTTYDFGHCVHINKPVYHISQLLNSAFVGYEEFCRSVWCYPQRPKAEVDNTLRDLQNSSYPTKAEFNNCFIIHSNYFLLLKGVSPLRSLFFRLPNITQPCPQNFLGSTVQ